MPLKKPAKKEKTIKPQVKVSAAVKPEPKAARVVLKHEPKPAKTVLKPEPKPGLTAATVAEPALVSGRPVLPARLAEASAKRAGRFIEAIGRRKTSVARVRIFSGSGLQIKINEKPLEGYFKTYELKSIVEAPFKRSGLKLGFEVSAKVSGGGIHSQAEAVRHGISRALEEYDASLRKILKPLGFLKRDPRMKERRKFGLKKARKAPQWAKR